jgi:hypothetical protein
MLDFNISPVLTQVLSDQPSMALMRLIFAAQEATSIHQLARH